MNQYSVLNYYLIKIKNNYLCALEGNPKQVETVRREHQMSFLGFATFFLRAGPISNLCGSYKPDGNLRSQKIESGAAGK